MWRLCAGLCRNAVRLGLVGYVWPDRNYYYFIRRDGHRSALGRAPVIRRSILTVLLCFSIHLQVMRVALGLRVFV